MRQINNIEFDRKNRRCEIHNLARYYCGCAYLDRKGEMVEVKNGEGPKSVPLVYYDENGVQHVIGNAEVEFKDGKVIAVAKINRYDNPFVGIMADAWIEHINLEAFSVSGPEKTYVLPAPDPTPYPSTPIYESGLRPDSTDIHNHSHATETNPSGEVDQCDRRDLHKPHEWQREFGAYFNVYCPGNKGDTR